MARTYRRKHKGYDSFKAEEFIEFESKYGGTYYKYISVDNGTKEFKKQKAKYHAEKKSYYTLPKQWRKQAEKDYRALSNREIYKAMTLKDYEETIPLYSRCQQWWSYF